MKVRTYKDEKGRVGILLQAQFCAEEESLIEDMMKNKLIIDKPKNPFGRSLAIIIDGNISPFSAIENSNGKRFHLSPFQEQNED